MSPRILVADAARSVLTAVRRDLEERGCEVDAVLPGDAPRRVAPGRYGAALVRGTGDAAALVAAIRDADPLLPVVVIFLDRKEAASWPGAGEAAEAVLVGPLTASAVGAVATLATRLRDAAAREAALAAKLAAAHGAPRELDFLKRLLFLEVRRSKRHGYPLSLAVLAIDGWDRLGPTLAAGARTALLADALAVVSASVRDIDLAVPFAGERLVVLMPHTDAEGALRVARRLCAKVRERPGAPKVTASAGVATHAGGGTVSFAGLVKRAGEALARAVAQGGDRAEPAEPAKRRSRISIG